MRFIVTEKTKYFVDAKDKNEAIQKVQDNNGAPQGSSYSAREKK